MGGHSRVSVVVAERGLYFISRFLVKHLIIGVCLIMASITGYCVIKPTQSQQYSVILKYLIETSSAAIMPESIH